MKCTVEEGEKRYYSESGFFLSLQVNQFRIDLTRAMYSEKKQTIKTESIILNFKSSITFFSNQE